MEILKDDPFNRDFVLPPRVPQGLAAVVESLTREVLREKPDDIYVFAAHHFEKLLTLREEHNAKRGTSKEYNFHKKLRKHSGLCELKECKVARSNRDSVRSSGWALNETAKVLERHRNALEDRDKGMRSEAVRSLTKEKKNIRSSSGSRNKRENRSVKSSNANHESSRRVEEEDGNAKSLKSIPQMPSALNRSGTDKKDIKMELRKNRLSGSLRERNSDSSNEYQQKTERVEVEDKCEDERRDRRTLRRNGSVEGNVTYRRRKSSSSSTIESETEKRELKKMQNVEQVKEYVARIFNTTKNAEESDSAYVERVQEVIDRTAPMIKEKLKELKADMLQRSKKRSEEKRNSTECDSGNEENAKIEKLKKRENMSGGGASETEKDKEEKRGDTLEARLIDTQHILEEISSSCHAKSQLNGQRPKSSNGRLHRIENNSESMMKTGRKISLPAVRPASSRSCRSLSRNELDNLTLPPISLEACRNILKKKGDTTLPTLSQAITDVQSSSSSVQVEEKDNNQGDLGEEISRLSTSIKEDVASTRQILENVSDAFRVTVTSGSSDLVSEQPERIDPRDETQVEEVFKDSLNVTPDLIDAPQRPDSLESQERPSTTESPLMDANSQLTGLEHRLKEIETIEKNVEKAFDTLTNVDPHIQDTKETSSSNESILNSNDTKVEVASPRTEEPENIKEDIKVSDRKDVEQNRESTTVETEKELENEEGIMIESAVKNVPTDQETEESKSMKSDDQRSQENQAENSQNISQNSDDSSSNDKKTQENDSSDSFNKEKEITYPMHLPLSSPPKELPYSYILTEGSPVEIPEFVTTVIIPDRKESSPEIESTDLVIQENNKIPEKRSPLEPFGEFIRPEPIECSTVDIDFIQGIKAGHEIAIAKQDLDGIKEEEEIEEDTKEFSTTEETPSTGSEQKTGKIGAPKLEDISEKEESEEIQAKESNSIEEMERKESTEVGENSTNVVENSLDGEESTEIGVTSTESTNEVKETTITDRSSDSASLDPARPIVPELNLDSLRDLSVSSFKMNDGDEATSLTDPITSDFTEQNLDIGEKEEKEENCSQQEEETNSNEKLKENDREKEKEDAKVVSPDQKSLESNTTESEKKSGEEEIVKEESRVQEDESPNKDECKDTNESVSPPIDYLKPEVETTNLDAEEEIAKKSIETDRAENTVGVQEEKKIEIADTTKDQEKSEISEENVVVAENDKQDDKDVICSSNISEIVASSVDSEIDGTVTSNDESFKEEKKEESEIQHEQEVLKTNTEEKNEAEESEKAKIEKKEISREEKEEKGEEKDSKSEEAIIEKEELHREEEENAKKKETRVEVTQEPIINEKVEENEDAKEVILSISRTDTTTNSSITTDTAATKIQAGIRGFLTRRRLEKENRQGSTLDSVPSIKDTSMNEEAVSSTASKEEKKEEDASMTTKTESVEKAPKIILSETPIAENSQNIPDRLITTVATKSRLRRENAVERRTLSAENAFASNGLQHTGEFHDCLPLPLFDITDKTCIVLPVTSEDQQEQDIVEQPEKPEEKSTKIRKQEHINESIDSLPGSNKNSAEESIETIDPSSSTSFPKGLATFLGQLHSKGLQDITKLLVTQTSPVVVGLVDVAPPLLNMNNEQGIKDESNLQNRYLNFITSVEDAESDLMKNPNLTVSEANYATDEKSSYDISDTQSSKSIREPLALPGTPQRVIIEEITSLDSLTASKIQSVSGEAISLDSTHEITEKTTTDSLDPLELLEEENENKNNEPVVEKIVDELSKTSSTGGTTDPSTLPSERSDAHEEATLDIEHRKVENIIDEKSKEESHESSISNKDNANEKLEAETKQMENETLDETSNPEVSVKKNDSDDKTEL